MASVDERHVDVRAVDQGVRERHAHRPSAGEDGFGNGSVELAG
jgi:hypothetical protein